MPVELRKRKAVEPAPAPPVAKKSALNKVTEKVKAVISSPKKESKEASASTSSAPSVKATVGNTVDLATFGGEVETNDGKKTTLKQLVEESKAGVVLFTYPKASTPGCTKQACLFRDSYTPLTATGFLIYGLSTDSPKANTTFQTKQKLPYPLLCDPNQTLISAIGMKKAPKSTTRGVFVVDKSGKILAAEPGGPDATVAVVKKLVGSSAPVTENGNVVEGKKADDETKPTNEVDDGVAAKVDAAKAEVAAEVADTAEKLDSNGTPAL